MITTCAFCAIVEDSDGILWIGTRDGGLNRFEPDLQRFQRIDTAPVNNSGSISGNIRHILPDSNNVLWLATNEGLSRYHSDSG